MQADVGQHQPEKKHQMIQRGIRSPDVERSFSIKTKQRLNASIYLFIFYKNILQPLTVPAFNGGFLHEYKVALTLTFVFVCLA